MTSAVRTQWLLATSDLSPLARRVLDQFDGAVTVSRRACDVGSSCSTWVNNPLSYKVSLSRFDFGFSDGTRFVALHELGHIVDFIGLDAIGYKAFRALFAHSPRWKRCFPDPGEAGHCVPFAEIFADQFSFWANHFLRDPEGGYGDPPLASGADFGRVLAAQFAFRPPFWRNPVVNRG